MNQLLQRTYRILLYSRINNNVQLSAFIRMKNASSGSASTPGSNFNSAGGTQKRTITPLSKITLVQPNQPVAVTTLKEAQKLAKRRELHLVKQQDFDSKTQRPTYKLVTAAEMLSEDVDESAVDWKKSIEKKSEKSLSIGSRITDHDLASRLKHISKWLAKNHEVCILIQGSPEEMVKCEHILKTIEQSIKEPEIIGRIAQKRAKGSHIKFNIQPVAKSGTEPEKAA